MIFFSLVFDFLDGLIARIFNINNPIGKELDSLADMISFGLVPGIIIFTILQNNCLLYPQFSNYIWISFLIPLFSALRLANFNLYSYKDQNFKGLATPINTIFFISLTIIRSQDPGYILIQLIINNPILIIMLIFFSCFLLVSKISFFSFKFKSFSWKENKYHYLFLILSILCLIILRSSSFICIVLLYIIFSILFKKKFNLY